MDMSKLGYLQEVVGNLWGDYGRSKVFHNCVTVMFDLENTTCIIVAELYAIKDFLHPQLLDFAIPCQAQNIFKTISI